VSLVAMLPSLRGRSLHSLLSRRLLHVLPPTPFSDRVPRATAVRLADGVGRSFAGRRLSAAAAPAEQIDTRPFPLRYWKSLLFASVVCAWLNSLRVSNKTSTLRKEMEERVEADSPTNPDELLELRALNDTPSSKIAQLPALASKRLSRWGRASVVEATTPQLLQLLQEAVGGELREVYVLERMLMAIAESKVARGEVADPPPPILDVPLDVRMATATLMFLSSGSVVERLEAMFDVLQQQTEDGRRAVSAEKIEPLLASLIATGQVPPEKQVEVINEGKNELGFGRDWYRVQPVVRLTSADWAAQVLQPPAAEPPGAEEASEPVTAPESPPLDRVELEQFIQMLQGDVVCIWGECHLIHERKRQKKIAEEIAESARNPSWSTRAWNAVFGSSGTPVAESATAPNADAASLPPVERMPQESSLPKSPPSTADFEPAESFTGARQGYVFKLGPMGLGYYKD